MDKRQVIGRMVWLWLLMGLLAACGLGGEADAPPPTAVGRNGLPVAEEFLRFYQEYGGRRVLGDPISEAFVAEANGRTLQYFQSVRLEHDAASGEVSVTPLGQWALDGLNELVLAPTPENSAARTFPNSAFTVQDEFRTFYETYGGETLLGAPISPQLSVDDLRVQYFANGRLEWRPEAPTDRRVQLSPLGQAHFDSDMRFTYQTLRDARPVPSAGVSAVTLDAYVKAPILYNGEAQVLYVTVQTTGGAPVTGMAVDLILSFGDASQSIPLGATDDNGQISFPLTAPVPPGEQVTLRLQASSSDGRMIGETVVTYKTWW